MHTHLRLPDATIDEIVSSASTTPQERLLSVEITGSKIVSKTTLKNPPPIDMLPSKTLHGSNVQKHSQSPSIITIESSPPLPMLKHACSPSIEITFPILNSKKQKCLSRKIEPDQKVEPSHGIVQLNSMFATWEEAQDAVYEQEERRVHKWRMGQSKHASNGTHKKITLRCNHYHHHTPTHSMAIDPSDHHRGKTIKTGCNAHVNVNWQPGGHWHVTMVNWKHNHDGFEVFTRCDTSSVRYPFTTVSFHF